MGVSVLSGTVSISAIVYVFEVVTQHIRSHPVTGPTSGGLQEYGYVSEGESFTIADPHEVWSSDF